MNTNSSDADIVELFPTSETEVEQAIVRARCELRSVYGISGGRNWGYGEKSTHDSRALLLNLSRMNRILGFNSDTGVIRLQPGVTQGDLESYLEAKGMRFHVPNTGAGERGTLLGNALERGFGIAPILDHAETLLSIRGFLGDGSLYESPLSEIDRELADAFPWGVGPQLDRLVSQSSWILITEFSLQLSPKTTNTDLLIWRLSDETLVDFILGVSELLKFPRSYVGAIKIFHRWQAYGDRDPGWSKFIQAEWVAVVVVYSEPNERRLFIQTVAAKIGKRVKRRAVVLNRRRLSFLRRLLRFLPARLEGILGAQLGDLNEYLRLAEGHTSEVGFKVVDKDFDLASEGPLDMEKILFRFAWWSPICPLNPPSALKLLAFVRAAAKDSPYDFRTLTWTVLNAKTLALVVPISFKPEEQRSFFMWFERLHLELKREGFIPYRFHARMMGFLTTRLLPNYFRHVQKFEKAFDPANRLQASRYHGSDHGVSN